MLGVKAAALAAPATNRSGISGGMLDLTVGSAGTSRAHLKHSSPRTRRASSARRMSSRSLPGTTGSS
jgi:hypothetical protein